MNTRWDSHCNSPGEAFRLLLTTLSLRLDAQTLPQLKYQCSDYVGRGRLEKIETHLELFTVLEERDIVSSEDVNFLISCLGNIGRKDLARMVRQYLQRWCAQQSYIEASSSYHREHKAFEQCPISKGFAIKENSCSFTDNSKRSESTVIQEEASEITNTAQPFATRGFAVESSTYGVDVPPEIIHLIRFYTNRLSYNWQATLRYVGVTDEIIDSAVHNWPNDFRRQIRESLEYWARTGGNVTREGLMDAARRTGRNDIADELSTF